MPPKKRPIPLAVGSASAKKIRVGASIPIPITVQRGGTTARIENVGTVRAPVRCTKDSVRERFMRLLEEPRYRMGASNRVIQAEFSKPDEKPLLVEIINELSKESKLLMSKSAVDNDLFYTLVSDDVAQKYAGLDVSAKLVLQCIEKAANKGIWTKEIRMQTNIQQQALNKIFKLLEQRHLIKPVKSVTAKAKKLYMLYELTPSKELTGGVWYSGLEFDHEFISELRTFALQCVKRLNGGQGVTLDEIKNKMVQAKVSRVELNSDEVKQLVQTLVYDYYIEAGTVNDNGEIRYVLARRVSTMCDFKWWDALSPDFHFRSIRFEDGVVMGPHEPHHHTS
jgi:DNA-directed RNA polymerase III subunit RPC6